MAKINILPYSGKPLLRKKSRLRLVVKLELERATQDLLELYEFVLENCPDNEVIDSPVYIELYRAVSYLEKAHTAYRRYYRQTKTGGVR